MSKDPIVVFLRARLNEDEQVALDWQSARLILTEQFRNDPRRQHVRAFRERVTDAQRAEYRYHDRFDPDRALREVEAKRLILAHHSQGDNDTCRGCLTPGMIAAGMQCTTVQLLALPYADHPDYREEWRP